MYLSPNRARHLLLPFPRATTELLLNFRPGPRAKETIFRAFSGSAGPYHAPKLALRSLGFRFRNGRAVDAGIISNDPSFPGYLSLRPFSGTEHEYRVNRRCLLRLLFLRLSSLPPKRKKKGSVFFEVVNEREENVRGKSSSVASSVHCEIPQSDARQRNLPWPPST